MSRSPKLSLRDLVADPATGRLSHSKLWSNVGCAAATFVFVRMGWAGTMSGEIFGLFLAGVCGHAAVSKMLSLKYQAQARQEQSAYGGMSMGPAQGGGF